LSFSLYTENPPPSSYESAAASGILKERCAQSVHKLSPEQPATSRLLSYNPRRNSALPPRLSNAAIWEKLDNRQSPDLRLTLPRSTTQPNLTVRKLRRTPPCSTSQSYLPPKNIFRVETNMPLEYWAGRFTSLHDQMRGRELCGELPTNAAMCMAYESPGMRSTKEESMVKDIFTVMYMSCDNETAADNLKVSPFINSPNIDLVHMSRCTFSLLYHIKS
jgi:hypothetical protein